MMHVLRGLGRRTIHPVSLSLYSHSYGLEWTDSDMVYMFDYAFKQNPMNEELGIQSFFANLRTSNWKAGQQVRNANCIIHTDHLRLFVVAQV